MVTKYNVAHEEGHEHRGGIQTCSPSCRLVVWLHPYTSRRSDHRLLRMQQLAQSTNHGDNQDSFPPSVTALGCSVRASQRPRTFGEPRLLLANMGCAFCEAASATALHCFPTLCNQLKQAWLVFAMHG